MFYYRGICSHMCVLSAVNTYMHCIQLYVFVCTEMYAAFVGFFQGKTLKQEE